MKKLYELLKTIVIITSSLSLGFKYQQGSINGRIWVVIAMIWTMIFIGEVVDMIIGEDR